VVPGGGISPDASRWIPSRKSFFLPVRVLSRLFRKKFLIYLRKAFRKGKLRFHGDLASLAEKPAFEALSQQASKIEWVVYAKRPFGGPQQVLKYLARYTHRVAISNSRLLSLQNGRVSFEWKDYAGGNQIKVMTLEAAEFIRRFLLHVLPTGFVRIRQFGFLANRVRKKKMALCRSLLAAQSTALDAAPMFQAGVIPEIEPQCRRCPICKVGRLIVVEIVPREEIVKAEATVFPPAPVYQDTS